MITAENMSRHELIGLHAEVSSSNNPQLVGLYGAILDETKNMLTIKTKSGVRHIPKAVCTWRLTTGNTSRTIEGAALERRPYERLGVRNG